MCLSVCVPRPGQGVGGPCVTSRPRVDHVVLV